DGKDYKTDKGRKLSFMRGIFISCWINHKKRKKLEGTLFGHPLYYQKACFNSTLKQAFCRNVTNAYNYLIFNLME
ncbi:hypothetical protein J8K77_19640, partial [Bacteroides fragilis]|nr:hypothetical protein [Bacteroides fragilis]